MMLSFGLVIQASILFFFIAVLLQAIFMLQLGLAIVLLTRLEMLDVLNVLLVEKTVVLVPI